MHEGYWASIAEIVGPSHAYSKEYWPGTNTDRAEGKGAYSKG